MSALWHWLAWRAHPACIVTLKGQEGAVSGVVWGQRADWLVVRQAVYLAPDGTQTHADGEVLVSRDQVQFIQLLPPTAAQQEPA